MANKLIKRKYNKLLTARNNYFKFGDFLFKADDSGNVTNRSFNNLSDVGTGVLKGIGTAVGSIGDNLISGGLSSGAGNAISSIGSTIGNIVPGPYGAAISAAAGIVGGGINKLWGSKVNEENVAAVENNINEMNNFQANASDFDSLSQLYATAPTSMSFSKSYLGKQGAFSHKIDRMQKRLNNAQEEAAQYVQDSLDNNASNLVNTQMQNALTDYFAYGGPIHIKPENKGKFTETKRRTGKTTEELTHSKNPLTRKRAIFAQNAKKWHHANGGNLMTHGADFTNGLTVVGNGGTHEDNPLEGVPMGVDPQGIPNLVEEGETIFNDYVFSKRLYVPKEMRNKYKFGKKITFADASKKLAKESEERPNDPISKRGLETLMGELAFTQEALKAEEQENLFANGGKVNKYDGITSETQQMIPYNWTPFLHSLNNYTASRLAGNTAGKYRPDTDIPIENNPFMFGTTTMAELENNQAYKNFTDAMVANPNLDYLRALDAGVAEGVPTLFDTDNTLKSNWADLFKQRRTDSIGGIYHWTPTYRPVNRAVRNTIGAADYADKYLNKGLSKDSMNPEISLTKWGSAKKNGNINTPDRGKYYDALRYAPAVGYGIGALTDALGITNKPSYANADALAKASLDAGKYMPASFTPIGNYLKYEPLDRDYYLNKMNAEAGATRKMLYNTSGGSRTAARAGALAADNNYLNQIGTLARQAKEADLAQRAQVADFNRATDMFNTQGYKDISMANQNAAMNARNASFSGLASALQMRENARLLADQNKSNNISGLFQSLGDIGFEEKNARMRDWAIKKGIYGPGVEDYGRFSAKGGKIKRKKKGLTF